MNPRLINEISMLAQQQINEMTYLMEKSDKKFPFEFDIEKKGKSKRRKNSKKEDEKAYKYKERNKKREKRKEDKKRNSAYNPLGSNPNIVRSLEKSIQNKLDAPGVDLAQVAADMWPNVKPKSRQSKLRKKVKGAKTPDGKHRYHFRKGDLVQLYKSKEFNRLNSNF
jgi:hypothetical protein